MFSKANIVHICNLARLEISKKETKKFQKEIEIIVNYINQLKRVRVKEIKIDEKKIDLLDLREDKKEIDRAQREKILYLIPETKEDYIKVWSII